MTARVNHCILRVSPPPSLGRRVKPKSLLKVITSLLRLRRLTQGDREEDMSSELVKRAPLSLVPSGDEWKMYIQMRDVMMAIPSMVAKFGTSERALAVALFGRELGIPPMQAGESIDFIAGVPSPRVKLLLSLAYERLPGFRMEVLETTEAVWRGRMRRSASHNWNEDAYTIKEALNQGLLSKDNWKKDAKTMLSWRGIDRLLSITCPDVTRGFYGAEIRQDFEEPPPRIIKEDIIDISGAEEIKDAEIVPVDEMFPKPIEEAK